MKKLFFAVLVVFAAECSAQTFTFRCVCDYLTQADSNCDICTTSLQSRLFKGLLIYKNGVAYKWIEQPYTILQNFDALTFKELIPNAEQIRIDLIGTAFDSIEQFRDSVMCPCSGGSPTVFIAGPGIVINGDTISAVDTTQYNEAWTISDSTNYELITNDTVYFVGAGITTVAFDSVTNVVTITTPAADGSETIITEGVGISISGTGTSSDPYIITNTGDLSDTNEAWTIDADDADTELITSQTVKFQGGGINVTDYDPVTNTLLITGTEADGDPSNELQALTAGDGAGDNKTINLSLGGGTITLDPSGIFTISRSGNTFTMDATEADGDPANELQTLANTSAAGSHTVTLSNSGGSVQFLAGSGLSFTSGGTSLNGTLTLSTTFTGGGGIYGDGTAGSGDDALPPGGSTVTVPGEWQPLTFDMNISGGEVWTALEVNLATCSDDRFGRYLVGKSPSDSLQIYNFDCGAVINETGGLLTLQTDREMYFFADSFAFSVIPTATVLEQVVGLNAQGFLNKIEGTSTGQTLVWNNTSGRWELGSGSSGPSGTGTANRVAYWTGASTLAADDDFAFDGTSVGIGTTTLTGKLNITMPSTFVPFVFNAYAAASSSGGVVYGQISNTLTTSTTFFSLNEQADVNTVRAGLRRFGSTHSTRPNELDLVNVQSAAVTISTNNTTRVSVANTGELLAINKVGAGFSTTTGLHSTLQTAGSFAGAYLETVGAPTFGAGNYSVTYTNSTNVTWTLPAASTCQGRVYWLFHANTAGVITISPSISKGNGGNFNTLNPGEWARVVSSGTQWRGFKITSL